MSESFHKKSQKVEEWVLIQHFWSQAVYSGERIRILQSNWKHRGKKTRSELSYILFSLFKGEKQCTYSGMKPTIDRCWVYVFIAYMQNLFVLPSVVTSIVPVYTDLVEIQLNWCWLNCPKKKPMKKWMTCPQCCLCW